MFCVGTTALIVATAIGIVTYNAAAATATTATATATATATTTTTTTTTSYLDLLEINQTPLMNEAQQQISTNRIHHDFLVRGKNNSTDHLSETDSLLFHFTCDI